MKTIPRIEVICDLIQGIAHEKVTPQTHLGSIGMDSLDRAELTMALEEEFGIKTDTSDHVPLMLRMTVQQVHTYYCGLRTVEQPVPQAA